MFLFLYFRVPLLRRRLYLLLFSLSKTISLILYLTRVPLTRFLSLNVFMRIVLLLMNQSNRLLWQVENGNIRTTDLHRHR